MKKYIGSKSILCVHKSQYDSGPRYNNFEFIDFDESDLAYSNLMREYAESIHNILVDAMLNPELCSHCENSLMEIRKQVIDAYRSNKFIKLSLLSEFDKELLNPAIRTLQYIRNLHMYCN